MDKRLLPKYPVYIPSKGRPDKCLTARRLAKDGVPFRIVVEPQEREAYTAEFGNQRLLVLPFSDLGQGSIPARNWIKEHATNEGYIRHWQLDDNIRVLMRLWHGERLYCASGVALAVTEDFIDRYDNIAIGGLNYTTFAVGPQKPFVVNTRIYSCALVLNSLPYQWRGKYNEDTDLCLQVLVGGYCTLLMNAYLIEKRTTMTMQGGNCDSLYKGDGRLRMARSLERLWPHVARTKRRFQRPQHVIRNGWRNFDTPLKRRTDIDWSALEGTTNEYGMVLTQVKPEIKSTAVRQLLAEAKAKQGA